MLGGVKRDGGRLEEEGRYLEEVLWGLAMCTRRTHSVARGAGTRVKRGEGRWPIGQASVTARATCWANGEMLLSSEDGKGDTRRVMRQEPIGGQDEQSHARGVRIG